MQHYLLFSGQCASVKVVLQVLFPGCGEEPFKQDEAGGPNVDFAGDGARAEEDAGRAVVNGAKGIVGGVEMAAFGRNEIAEVDKFQRGGGGW